MFSNVTEANGVVSQLRELQCYASEFKTLGICEYFGDYPDLVETYSKGWEHHTGEENFPVPCPDYPDDPGLGYLRCNNLWSGEYGRLRKDLCRHIADAIDKEIRYGMYD